jgi:hypothetical protein
VQQLTTIQDQEKNESFSMTEKLLLDDPYPDKTPSTVLTREYLVGSYTITVGTDLVLWPSDMIMAVPAIASYLKPFRLVRYPIKLKFQFQTLPLQYGLIGISCLPYMLNSQTTWADVKQQSQSSMELLDVSSQEAYELDLPWNNPFDFEFVGSTTRRQWRVILHPFYINAISTATPTTIRMNLYASMPEPKAAGYIIPSYPEPDSIFQSTLSTTALFAGVDVATNIASRYVYDRGSSYMSSVTDTASCMLNNPRSALGCFSSKAQASTNTENKVRLDVVGDISSPTSKDMSTVTRLGDGIEPMFNRSVTSRDVSDIRDLVCRPTFYSDAVFTTASTTTMTVSCSPIVPYSHCSYVSRMFKFFRGSTRVMFTFHSSQLVTGRFLLKLYPASGPVSGDPIGDIPTWTITIKGSRKFIIDVPYLQTHPWQGLGSGTYLVPQLVLSLYDNLPQPFDKTAAIYVACFVAPCPDIQFSGLQSCVPDVTPDSVFQCQLDSDFQGKPDETYPMAGPRPYMGGLTNIYEILNRYSSRGRSTDATIDPLLLFSTPTSVPTWDQLYNYYDNFDYVSTLFKFFRGECQTKTIFSSAPTNGIIAALVSNSNRSDTGDPLKAGNSMSLTHQTIWPELDVTFPYMCEVPFNGVAVQDAITMYQIEYNEGAVISKFLISAAPSFALMYLMPVPDFFIAGMPPVAEERSINPAPSNEKDEDDDDDSTFQSAPSRQVLVLGFDGDGTTSPQWFPFATPIGAAGSQFGANYELSLTRAAGTTDQSFLICIQNDSLGDDFGTGALALNLTGVIIHSIPAVWCDETGNGKYICNRSGDFLTNNSQLGQGLGIQIHPLGTVCESGSRWIFILNLDVNDGTQLSLTTANTHCSPIFTDIGEDGVYVYTDTPLSVSVDAQMISLGVLVENEGAIPVSLDGSVTLDGPVAVYGDHTGLQTAPLWVSQYGPPPDST